jgi:hypothetical protein
MCWFIPYGTIHAGEECPQAARAATSDTCFVEKKPLLTPANVHFGRAFCERTSGRATSIGILKRIYPMKTSKLW